jgi:hypothetical protein
MVDPAARATPLRGSVVWQWLRDNSPALSAIAALIAIVGLVLGAGRLLFKQPPVSVYVAQSQLVLPPSLSRGLDSLLTLDFPQTDKSRVKSILTRLKDFFSDTRSFTAITVSNNSAQSIAHVEVRVQDVFEMSGYGATGTHLLGEEQKAVLDSIHYDPVESLLRLRSIPRLPPKSSVSIWIWGHVPYSEALGSDQVAVTYDGGAGELVRRYEVQGLDAFVYRNSSLLLLAILMLNLGLFQIAIEIEVRRRRREEGKASADQGRTG